MPLAKLSVAPSDLFSELYRNLVPEPKPPLPPPPATVFNEEGGLIRPEDIEARDMYEAAIETHAVERAQYEEAVNSGARARAAFRSVLFATVTTEAAAISVLENTYSVIDDYNINRLSSSFVTAVDRFIEKFSLRYDLRRPFAIQPTLSGVFTQLINQLKIATANDVTLNTLMLEFEDAVRDLRFDRSGGKIKSCIQKQINLLEAVGARAPGVTANTLGRICDQIGTWPHDKVKDAMKALYSFSCDYPGIRHGGTPFNQHRDIAMKDLISISVILAGFSPYLTDLINADNIYHGP